MDEENCYAGCNIRLATYTTPDDARRRIPERCNPELMLDYVWDTVNHPYTQGESGDF